MKYGPGDGKYYEARCRIIEHKLEGLSAVIDARLKAMDEALKLKAGELERRLEMMNRFREDIEKDRGEFVRKENFESAMAMATRCREDREAAMDLFKDSYNLAHSTLANRVTILETRIVTWTAAIAALFVLVQLGFKYLHQ